MNPSVPLVLGFDTSAAYCTAALVQGEAVLAHRREDMSKGQAERIMGLIDDVLNDAGKNLRDLAALGVGIGPGNFTGLRISVSAARGMALGLGIPAVGVSAFDALRFGTEGGCVCTVDARRDQIYVQVIDASGEPHAPVIATAATLPEHAGPVIGVAGMPPVFPMAIAIAHVASQRFATTTDRPAPLYLRPADAAPARDAAPALLP